jgi:hypothetical protein
VKRMYMAKLSSSNSTILRLYKLSIPQAFDILWWDRHGEF